MIDTADDYGQPQDGRHPPVLRRLLDDSRKESVDSQAAFKADLVGAVSFRELDMKVLSSVMPPSSPASALTIAPGTPSG